jgi:quinone-modifying oxidoreductase, subunit QmoB
MDKIGTYICTGCDIGAAVDIDALEKTANGKSAKVVRHECLCSKEGVGLIHADIDAGTVNGVLVAACSHRAKTEVFRFDRSKAATERVSLREQVAWTQPHGEEDTQMLADDLMLMGLVKLSKQELPKLQDEPIDRSVLVVGGGLAGLTAAKAAAGMGHSVVLVEKEGRLGGYLRDIKEVIPEAPPYSAPHENPIKDLIAEVEGNSDIRVLTSTTLKRVEGQPGQFKVEVEGDSFEAGAIVQATGASPVDPGTLEYLGYGKSPDVVTSQQMEEMLAAGKVARPSDGSVPGRIVFIQCAGSRDQERNPYCSAECCGVSLKQIAAIKRDFKDIECAVIYKDIRAPGQLEHLYAAVQDTEGTMFARGEVDHIEPVGGGLGITVKESPLGEGAELSADMVVLALGMVPSSADGEAIRELHDAYGRIEKNESETQVAEAKKLVDKLVQHEGTEILNLKYRQGPDMPVLKYSFPDSHYICFPYETRRTGIYAAGALHAPMDVHQAAEDAFGAAMKAVQCIEANTRGEAVHPRAGDVSVADFFLQRCTQCKRCTEECPFGTINEDAKGTPEYQPLRCRRCGICLGACPERIISFPEYSVDGVASMIKSFDVPEEFDEKPRIIVFMCENDALPAFDTAAKKRIQMSPWIRIIPVRCLGACNNVWVAESLSRGIDGVLLIGCKRGDDYQCHYIRGSELAHTRISNIGETLTRLALESERVEVVELARDEFHRIPEVIQTFVDTMEEIGPNPLKGF